MVGAAEGGVLCGFGERWVHGDQTLLKGATGTSITLLSPWAPRAACSSGGNTACIELPLRFSKAIDPRWTIGLPLLLVTFAVYRYHQ